MAYRTFEEVSDIRPLPSGFATGFNPDIPTAAEVEAVKQKAAQEQRDKELKDPSVQFKAGAKRDEEYLTFNQGLIRQYIDDDIAKTGKISDQTKSFVTQLNNEAGKSIQDIDVYDGVLATYGKDPKYKDAVATYANAYGSMPLNQRPPAKEYFAALDETPEKFLSLNVDTADYVKNLGEKAYQSARESGQGGITFNKETYLKSKFKDGKVDEFTLTDYLSDPARAKTVDYRRQLNDIENIKKLNTKTGTVRRQNLDGTFTEEVVTFNSPEELAEAVSKGQAYPSDNSKRPLKGFESGFNTQVRNNKIATNFLLGAAGITRKNETSTIIDEDEAGVRSGFGFGIRTRPEIVLAEGKETQAIQQFGLAEKLIKAGVPKADAERAQFENKTALLPSVVKNGESKLISLEGVNIPDASGQFVDTYVGQDGKPIALRDAKRTEMPKNVKIFSAEPITTNSSGHRVVIPKELKGDKIVTYLTERTGTNSRGKLKGEIAVNLVTENSAGELEPIVYRLKDWQDPVWIKFATVATPGVKQSEIRKNAKKMYDDLMAKNQYLPQIKEAVSIQEKEKAKKETPQKKVKPVNTPKPKAKVSL
jgi:hypothetical protein